MAVEEEDATAKPESFFSSLLPWQVGHEGAGDDARTSVSNSVPQELHAYSKMGMFGIPP